MRISFPRTRHPHRSSPLNPAPLPRPPRALLANPNTDLHLWPDAAVRCLRSLRDARQLVRGMVLGVHVRLRLLRGLHRLQLSGLNHDTKAAVEDRS